MKRFDGSRVGFLSRNIIRLLPGATFGVVVGHLFVYKMFFPEQDHYHDVMHSTGHAYFSVAIVVAGLFALFSFFVHILLGYKDKKKGHSTVKLTFWKQAAALIVIQFVVFTLMELTERHALLDIHKAADFITSPLFLVGLLYQVVVALGVNLMLYGAEKIGHLISALELAVPKSWIKVFCLYLCIQCSLVRTFNCRAPPVVSFYLS